MHQLIECSYNVYKNEIMNIRFHREYGPCTKCQHCSSAAGHKQNRAARAENKTTLEVTKTLWNRLPENIKNAPDLNSFKKLLKAHQFNR